MNAGKDDSASTPDAQGSRSDSLFLSLDTVGWIITVMIWMPIWMTAAAIRMITSSDQNRGDDVKGSSGRNA
jgi:hypothetical protein